MFSRLVAALVFSVALSGESFAWDQREEMCAVELIFISYGTHAAMPYGSRYVVNRVDWKHPYVTLVTWDESAQRVTAVELVPLDGNNQFKAKGDLGTYKVKDSGCMVRVDQK